MRACVCQSVASSYRMYRYSCRGWSLCIWRQILLEIEPEGAYHHKSEVSGNAEGGEGEEKEGEGRRREEGHEERMSLKEYLNKMSRLEESGYKLSEKWRQMDGEREGHLPASIITATACCESTVSPPPPIMHHHLDPLLPHWSNRLKRNSTT